MRTVLYGFTAPTGPTGLAPSGYGLSSSTMTNREGDSFFHRDIQRFDSKC